MGHQGPALLKSGAEHDEGDVLDEVFVRANLSCTMDIELTYHSAGNITMCIHCGSDQDLQTKDGFYPQCSECTRRDWMKRRGENK